MKRTSGVLLLGAAAALLAAAGPGLGQAQPLPAPGPATASLKVTVWACPAHENLHSTETGTCPLDGKELARKSIELPRDPYPLATCPVSGKAIGEMGSPVILVHEGREIRFCCGRCVGPFQADAKKYLAEIDAKIIEQQLPYYPLTTCPVSGEALGSMGEPVTFVYNNRLVRFCCNGCVRGFKKDPAAALAALDAAAIAAQAASYPLDTCPVSKEKLGSMGKPVEIVVANRLVRFCCAGCVSGFYEDVPANLAALNEAWSAKQPGGKPAGQGG